MGLTLKHRLAQRPVCLRKVKYETRVDADLAIAELWTSLGRDLVKYQCGWCHKYHLTSGGWERMNGLGGVTAENLLRSPLQIHPA